MRTRRPRTNCLPVNGPAVRKLRQLRGMEMIDLAALVGIDRSYLNKIELGKGASARNVSPTVFGKLVEKLQPRRPEDLIVKPRRRRRAAA